jgi:lactate dehydrogenase-like 2-hydroxyacid dehydrogenase
MIKILDSTEGNLVAIRATGNITKEDYEKIVPVLKEKIEEYGGVKWYFEMSEDHKWDMGALAKDIAFDFSEGRNVEKIAIVGAGAVEEQLTKLLKPLIGGPVRFFDSDEKDEALSWIS